MAVKHPVAEATAGSLFGRLTADEFYARHGVSHGSAFHVNPRAMRIFTQWWTPVRSSPPAGVVAVVHGFTSDSNWLVQLTAVLFAESGFAVAAIDHQGHGFSDGLPCHVPDIEPVVDDCVAFFDSFRSRYPRDLPAFLYGESLGGAIALLMHLRGESPAGFAWDGAVLNGAMCGVSAKFKPPWPVEQVLRLLAAVAPTWPVAFTRGSIPDRSFKVDWKRQLVLSSPSRKVLPPRAGTARELLRVCAELQGKFEQVTLPLLIVHGAEDVICDLNGAEELHRRASSKDKTLRVHESMWHQLVGEADEDVDLVFGEVVDWLMARAASAVAAAADEGSGEIAEEEE